MHNEKLIRELYHGNIQPNAKMIVSGSEYQKTILGINIDRRFVKGATVQGLIGTALLPP